MFKWEVGILKLKYIVLKGHSMSNIKLLYSNDRQFQRKKPTKTIKSMVSTTFCYPKKKIQKKKKPKTKRKQKQNKIKIKTCILSIYITYPIIL